MLHTGNNRILESIMITRFTFVCNDHGVLIEIGKRETGRGESQKYLWLYDMLCVSQLCMFACLEIVDDMVV